MTDSRSFVVGVGGGRPGAGLAAVLAVEDIKLAAESVPATRRGREVGSPGVSDVEGNISITFQ